MNQSWQRVVNGVVIDLLSSARLMISYQKFNRDENRHAENPLQNI